MPIALIIGLSLDFWLITVCMCKVLSETVAKALDFYGNEEATETKRFVDIFDTFFDCLNVRSLEEHHRRRKPNLAPYRQMDDGRLNVRYCYNEC